MNEERLPQNILNRIPTGRRKRGRSKARWKEGISRAMEECDLRDGDFVGDWVSKDVAIHHTMTAYIHLPY
jgi:hypothetical protein